MFADESAAFAAELQARIEAVGERDGRSIEQRLEDHHEDVVTQLHNPRGSVDRMAHPAEYGDAGTSIVQAGLTFGSGATEEPDYSDPEQRAALAAEVDADPEIQAINAQAAADAVELAELRQARKDDELIERMMASEHYEEELLLWSQVSEAGRARFGSEWGWEDADELTSASDRLTTALELRRAQARLDELEGENFAAAEADAVALRKLYGDQAVDATIEGLMADGVDIEDFAKSNPKALIQSIAAGAEAWKAANSLMVRDRLAYDILGPAVASDGTRRFADGFEINGVRSGDRRYAEYQREVAERGLDRVDLQVAIDRGRELVERGGKRGQTADEIRQGVLGQERTAISEGFEQLRDQAKRLRDQQLAGERRR
jgi:hypothetical protein